MIPRAARYSRGSTQSERSRDDTRDSTDEASTIQGHRPEDDRDRKLKELTATVEKLANVIEHMSNLRSQG